MKSIFYTLRMLGMMLFCFSFQKLKAQANTSLSNLVAPTAVNAELLPGADNTLNLGSAIKGWKQLYISNAVFMGGSKFISYGNTLSLGITAVGNNALAANTGGFANTGIGFYSLAANTNGNANAAIGTRSLQANITGSGNMAMGYFSLFSNTTGYSNVAIGVRAMLSSVADHNLVGIGDSSLFTANGAVANTAIGSKTMYSTTTGSFNVATGYKALTTNVTGGNNVGVGSSALRLNVDGSDNTAVGNQSQYYNSSGNQNTSLGGLSMLNNTTGFYNSAAGYASLYSNTTGSYNTTVGWTSLALNTTGNNNTVVGMNTMYYNTTGYANTGMGLQSLFNNTEGYNNTGLGDYALIANTTGYNNTGLGYDASPTDGTLTNTTSVGYNASATDNNQIMLGNTAVTSVMAAASFTIYSDGRFKKDIQTNVPGLDFINALRPVTYHYNIHGINKHIGKASPEYSAFSKTGEKTAFPIVSNTSDEAAVEAKEKILYTGFVAQEVETAAKKFNYDFSGLHKPQNDKDLYGLSYSDFVAPLVKGMQDLSDSNDLKRNEIDSLKAKLQRLEDLVNKLVNGQATGSISISDASLGQNLPNPFTGSTNINYSIPQNSGRARLEVSDMNGRIIKTISISNSGRGNLSIDASGLSSGVYNYSLYIDQRIVSTKQMVLTK